jgi:hypothetical protein
MVEIMFAHPLRFCFLLLIMLSPSCAQELGPQDVATRFWAAIEKSDARTVKRYITAAEAATLKSLDDVLPITDAELTRTVIEGQSAYIDTTVTVDSDRPLKYPLKTYLVLEDEHWKVDYEQTISAVAAAGKLAAVIDKVHEFGTALQHGIDRSVQELEHTLPQIEHELSRIEEQIKQQVPELRKRLENFAKELEDALKRPPGQEGQTEPEGSVAI